MHMYVIPLESYRLGLSNAVITVLFGAFLNIMNFLFSMILPGLQPTQNSHEFPDPKIMIKYRNVLDMPVGPKAAL